MLKSILEAEGHKTGLIGTSAIYVKDKKLPPMLTTPDPIDLHKLLKRQKIYGRIVTVGGILMKTTEMGVSYIDTTINTSITDCREKFNDKIYVKVKRIIDMVLSLVGLIVLVPVFLVLGITIKLDSKGPVFFKHKRVGKNGKEMYIYKFRTMVKNAEELIKDFSEEELKEFKENYKLKNDKRITRVGNFLRKTSLDELPQILNILKGELSIIGPRPVVEEELEKYGENKHKFLSATPGLTGYWAANGRSATTYEERMKMELHYIDNISLTMDIKVFFQTIKSVIKREGAL
jgi:lipopolysaccharide/colanic/teichoic acid biosynthesis glycosyltransferase